MTKGAMMVPVADPDVVKDMVEKHGISAALLPKVSRDQLQVEDARLLREQRDTLAYQWATEFARMEQVSRTCLYCDFVAKTRVSLRAHMKRHGAK